MSRWDVLCSSMLGVDANAVLFVAVVSEHLAVVTTSCGGLAISLLEHITSELSVVIAEYESDDAELADGASELSMQRRCSCIPR